MAEYVGKAMYLSFGGTALASDYRTFESNETNDTVDSSAGSDTYKHKLSTLIDGSCRLELVEQAGGSVNWNLLTPGTEGTLLWAEEGTASGKQRHSVLAIVKGRAKKVAYNDVTIQNLDFDFNGAVTNDNY